MARFPDNRASHDALNRPGDRTDTHGGMPTIDTPPFRVAERPWWAQALAMFGSFGGAIVLGSIIAWWAGAGNDALWAVQSFALLLIFIGGMAAWGAIAASIMARAFFNGDIVAAFLRFFLRGWRREDLPRIELRKEVILAAAQRVFGWTRIFPLLAVAIACVAAPVAGMLADRGFVVVAMVSLTVMVAYGFALRTLARRGFLIPPDLE